MSIIIINKFHSKNYFKRIFFLARNILGVGRGPSMVTKSLVRGLSENKNDYYLNPNLEEIHKDDIIYINESVPALRWALEAKKKGLFNVLMTGPAIVVTPLEKGSILQDKGIDRVLVPALWVKDFYLALAPEMSEKVSVWPAGVDTKKWNDNDRMKSYCLIYQKDPDKKLLVNIKGILKKNKIKYKVIKYGFYSEKKYKNLLSGARFTIFLSQSESQGISMFESWSMNVPTLVWNRGYMQYQDYKWEDDKMSSPYLADECGMFFKDEYDFDKNLKIFMEKIDLFRSRDYVVNNFSDKKIAQNFITIINEIASFRK